MRVVEGKTKERKKEDKVEWGLHVGLGRKGEIMGGCHNYKNAPLSSRNTRDP
jgi:hypothetical protein